MGKLEAEHPPGVSDMGIFSLNPFKRDRAVLQLGRNVTPNYSLAHQSTDAFVGGPGKQARNNRPLPAWQAGVKGAGVNPAAAQNPMNRPQTGAQFGANNVMGRAAATAAGIRGGGNRPTAAPTMGMGQVRLFSDGGKVFDRKPNGKRC